MTLYPKGTLFWRNPSIWNYTEKVILILRGTESCLELAEVDDQGQEHNKRILDIYRIWSDVLGVVTINSETLERNYKVIKGKRP